MWVPADRDGLSSPDSVEQPKQKEAQSGVEYEVCRVHYYLGPDSPRAPMPISEYSYTEENTGEKKGNKVL